MKVWIWILAAAIVAVTAVALLTLRRSSDSAHFGRVYRQLTGRDSLPLSEDAIRVADHAEYSIKVKKGADPTVDRLLLQMIDYDTFVKHIPTDTMRDWFRSKPPSCPAHTRCESFPYMMAADGRKKKVYCERCGGVSGMSFSSEGVQREYRRARSQLPQALEPIAPLTKKHRNHVRNTPGVAASKSYYMRMNTPFDDRTVDVLCALAKKQNMQNVDSLREWMQRARDLKMKPSWVQFSDKELTVYARLIYDKWRE